METTRTPWLTAVGGCIVRAHTRYRREVGVPPQRRHQAGRRAERIVERHYRVTYRLQGQQPKHIRVSVPANTHHLDTALRQAVSKHEMHIAARFHEVELLDFEEMLFRRAG
jgi:hypothetical protein